MWQALLAAAVAGSTGLVARRLFNPRYDSGDPGDQRNVDSDPVEFEPRKGEKGASFRFSTGDLRNSRRGRKSKKRESRVSERSSAGSESEKRTYGARRFGVSLKRRKICPNVSGKRAESCSASSSSSSSQDTSLFSWGLGVGMMCMMSAGKSELCKLNTAMTETTKVVAELKAELRKTNPSRDRPVSGHHKASLNEARNVGQNLIGDGDCASSVLTEEPGQGSREMDQLEAELEYELQKLPWSAMEASNSLIEDELSVQGFTMQTRRDSDPDRTRGNGILAEELDKKLCHVLIEQKENKIEDLEFELNLSQRKLKEKEAELRALRDCVKRLTEISISTLSDDEKEIEEDTEQELTSDWNLSAVEYDSRNTTVVGMKRPSDSRLT